MAFPSGEIVVIRSKYWVFGALVGVSLLLVVLFNVRRQQGAYTCEVCGSTKDVSRFFRFNFFSGTFGLFCTSTVDRIEYASPLYDTCVHKWTLGIHDEYPSSVSDGVVVLVRHAGVYGAFILTQQQSKPVQARYQWWYRTDGHGRFDESTNVLTGILDTGIRENGMPVAIEFGPFVVPWSLSAPGMGWIYFNDETELCLTTNRSIQDLDATDPRWSYERRRPKVIDHEEERSDTGIEDTQ